MAGNEIEQAADWFKRFAAAEGAESARYQDWANGIAADQVLLANIVKLPTAKRQPVLILTCARLAGVPLRPFVSVREDFVALWPKISKFALERFTQTNDPRRCNPLMIALSRVPGQIALIEVGASAGLNLYPDKYSYRWIAPGRKIAFGPEGGSPVNLEAKISGLEPRAPKLPKIVYREGIDLNPLDVRNDSDIAWLEALVWPEQTERLKLVRAAFEIVKADPPQMTPGDALAEVRSAVARARRLNPKATIVISSPAVLVYLDPLARQKFANYCNRAKVRWVSIDGREVLPNLKRIAEERGITGDFLLSLDGKPIAAVDPLGRSAELWSSSGLKASEIDFIEFERENWGAVRSKESLVRSAFDLPLVRYYQKLWGIMESKSASRYDPVLVRSFMQARQKF